MQLQKWYKDLSLFPRQTIQHHSNPNLYPSHWYWRSWSWLVLWRAIKPSRINTKKRCPFHQRGLECKSRKSRDTQNNRQVWPWSTKWSRVKANSFVQRTHWSWQTLFQQKRQFYTWTSLDDQHWNQVDYVPWKDWSWSANPLATWFQRANSLEKTLNAWK